MERFPIAAHYRSSSFLQQTHRQNHASFNYSIQWDGQPFKTDSGLYVFFWQSSWVSIFFFYQCYILNCSTEVDCEKPNNGAITGQRMRMTAKGRKLWKTCYEKKIPLEIKKSCLRGWLSCWECLLLKCIWTWIQMFSTLIKKAAHNLTRF